MSLILSFLFYLGQVPFSLTSDQLLWSGLGKGPLRGEHSACKFGFGRRWKGSGRMRLFAGILKTIQLLFLNDFCVFIF